MVRCRDLIAVLFPHLPAVLVERVLTKFEVVHIVARTPDGSALCPGCECPSDRVHSCYERRLADTPVGDQPVVIELTVRRLYCDNDRCGRRTFVEQVGGLTFRYGRRTPASRRILEAVAVALAGRAGARLAVVLHSVVSRTTLLRLLMAFPDPSWEVPKVLGVDVFATRRGQHYGTVPIDCETRKLLGLLLGRDAGNLAAWLREHPGIEVICRDRAGSYAEGARIGAPQAVQVADRFHLWQNLGTTVEQSVRRHNGCLRSPSSGLGDLPNIDPPPIKEMSPTEARIRARHAVVHTLLDQGHGIREIARELHMGGNTVRRCARAAAPEELLGGRLQPRPSLLDPYKSHLDKRWREGCTNAIQLHSELQTLGYRGSYQIISDYLRPRRRRRIRVVGPAPPGGRQVTRWIMRHPDRLSESEGLQLTEVLTHCPELAAAHRLVHSFADLLSTRTGQHLKDWVVNARAEELSGLRSFATGLEKYWDAVVQGLTSQWNSGPVEGRVNHIKMVKRQMFGRAKLPPLRKRVLLTAAR